MRQHPFVCVQWAGKEVGELQKQKAKPVTFREKKESAEEGPWEFTTHKRPLMLLHSPPATRFSGGPGLILPLLCWRPCFRPLWSPPTGGALTPTTQQVCAAGVGNPDSTNNRNDMFLATLIKYP